eukprot:SM000001S04650  [mRNA]  locus=s1:1490306:1492333:+ [translate_table: standard]
MVSKGSIKSYAARDESGKLSPFSHQLREVMETDVVINIKYCGICHSDLHQAKNEWGSTKYPVVPGHEIIGIVEKMGPKVSKFHEGDRVGVGCFVRSCHECDACDKGLENYCPKVVQTYGNPDWMVGGEPTRGGFSSMIIVEEKFVLRIPENLPSAAAAPLLCAGITTYSPLKHFGMTEPGKKLGVVGLGGLGHMAVKFGKGMDLHVTILSTSPSKEDEALNTLGADAFIPSKDVEKMKQAAGSLDYIIDTVSAPHPLEQYLLLLKVDGKMVLLGVPPEPYEMSAASLVFGRKMLAGSLVGGIKETQEMLDFCAKKNITCMIEMITLDDINTAFERMVNNDVKYRFVIDMEKSFLLNKPEE